ncbi:uncharacterized protein LOC133036982 [Cannabis sativa]|uniref:uncharacterized protein LOC133036982 n=1 Tax=Cannabis sativa TaxID=3483 RepID=UPI0029C9BD9B|nr:uncharacterized protein LOC133036982 [Cannabis sativa]
MHHHKEGPRRTPQDLRDKLNKKRQHLDKEMEDLRRRISSAASEEGSWDEEDFDDESHFSREIQSEQLPSNFKEPNISPYEGITDPKYHLDAFNEIMKMKRFTDELLSQHHASRDYVVLRTSLVNIKQGETKSLKSYIQCFNTEVTKVGRLSKDDHKMAIAARVRPRSKLQNNMLKRELDDLEDFYERANRYIFVEDGHENLGVGKDEQPVKTRAEGSHKKRGFMYKDDRQDKKAKRELDPLPREYTHYTKLTHSREHVYLTNEHHVFFKRLPPLKRERARRDHNKYCRFHKDVRHLTEECKHFKVKIEGLIQRGYLGEYWKENQRPNEPRQRDDQEEASEVLGDICTFNRGLGVGSNTRKG